MAREFWPPWFPVDEWFPQAAPYIEIAIDDMFLWILVLLLPFIVWDILAHRGKSCRKSFDRCADQAANTVRWRHLIGLAAFGIFAFALWNEGPWGAIIMAGILLWLAIALANRHQTLEYYRWRGIDLYKKQVMEDEERLRREYDQR